MTCRSQRGDHRYRRQPRDPHQGANVLVIIDEVPEGNWGARGQTISLAMIADTVGLAKTGERFRSVRAYIDATARVYGIRCGGLSGGHQWVPAAVKRARP